MAQVEVMQHRSTKSNLRLVGLVVGFIYLWMSTGVQLHHTDDLTALQTFSSSHTSIGHQTAPQDDDACLACLWSDTMQTVADADPPRPDVPSIRVARSDLLPSALHLSAFAYTQLRAPPFSA
jgi:hypothetical protein